MVKERQREVRIFVEGGGDQSEGRAKLRQGFSKFFSALRQDIRSVSVSFVMCGAGSDTLSTFLAERTRYDFCAFLVDSEQVPAAAETPWQHLRRTYTKPCEEPEPAQCHLMVVQMESWFLCDPDALADYYGKGFDRKRLPAPDKLEQLTKEQVTRALHEATDGTKPGRYQKIRHGADLLTKINPVKVQRYAPSCQRAFRTLREEIEQLAHIAKQRAPG